MTSEDKIWQLLEGIPDPEIPVISIVELGVIRAVKTSGSVATVNITPTYSGCPAMKQMEDDVIKTLKQNGFDEVKINTIYNPAWTSDWLSEAAKEKLKQYGIAPPVEKTSDKSFITGQPKVIACPCCGNKQTRLVSQFGSTACKALYQCQACLEAFDYFKCI